MFSNSSPVWKLSLQSWFTCLYRHLDGCVLHCCLLSCRHEGFQDMENYSREPLAAIITSLVSRTTDWGAFVLSIKGIQERRVQAVSSGQPLLSISMSHGDGLHTLPEHLLTTVLVFSSYLNNVITFLEFTIFILA